MTTPDALLDALAWRIQEALANDETDDLPRLIAWGDYLTGFHCDYSEDHITDRLPPRVHGQAIVERYQTPAWVVAEVQRWESTPRRQRDHLPDPDPHRLMTTGTHAERQARVQWHRDRIRTEASVVADILATRRRTPLPVERGSEELAGLLSLAHQRVDHHHAVAAANNEPAVRSTAA